MNVYVLAAADSPFLSAGTELRGGAALEVPKSKSHFPFPLLSAESVQPRALQDLEAFVFRLLD